MGQEGLFRGGGIFEERKSQFCPHILKLSADFKLLVGPNGRLMNPVKRQFANKGFSRDKLSKSITAAGTIAKEILPEQDL